MIDLFGPVPQAYQAHVPLDQRKGIAIVGAGAIVNVAHLPKGAVASGSSASRTLTTTGPGPSPSATASTASTGTSNSWWRRR